MQKTVHARLICPEKELFTAHVAHVVVPTKLGQATILPQHVPMLSLLQAGVVDIKHFNPTDIAHAKHERYFVSGGLLVIEPQHVLILVNDAEVVDNIDKQSAEQAWQQAEAKLQAADVFFDEYEQLLLNTQCARARWQAIH